MSCFYICNHVNYSVTKIVKCIVKNHSILLNKVTAKCCHCIYNSRNYSMLLNMSIFQLWIEIYNRRNYSILLNYPGFTGLSQSTTVEIILYYLTMSIIIHYIIIYNSRNYSILLNITAYQTTFNIYNSRNYSILLNKNSTYDTGI